MPKKTKRSKSCNAETTMKDMLYATLKDLGLEDLVIKQIIPMQESQAPDPAESDVASMMRHRISAAVCHVLESVHVLCDELENMEAWLISREKEDNKAAKQPRDARGRFARK